MDLKIITAVHDRFDMTEAFCKAAQRIRMDAGVETYAVVTNNDDCIDLLNKYQIHYIEHENKPLGKKWNAVVGLFRDIPFTHLMILGSDDIASTRFIEYALTLGEYDYSGVDGLWFWGLNPRRAGFERFGYFPIKGVLAGTGKVISRKVVEACDYSPWPETANYGMDAKMMGKTRTDLKGKRMPYNAKRYSMLDTGGFLMDVKYKSHISSLSPILRRPGYREQDPRVVLPKHIPENEYMYLFSLYEEILIDQAEKK